MTERDCAYSLRVRAKEDCNMWLRKGHVYDARPWDSHGMSTSLIVGCDVPRSFPKKMLEVVPDDTPLGPPLEKAKTCPDSRCVLNGGKHPHVDDLGGPAAAAVCSECGGAPCDCEKKVWVYWFRRLDHGLGPTQNGVDPSTRADLVERQAESKKHWPEYEYGPVQRVSDPPHDFGKTSETIGPAQPGPAAHGSPVDVRDTRRTVAPKSAPIDPAALARALFDEELEDEAMGRAEYGESKSGLHAGESHEDSVRRVLDIMWQKTKPDVRKRAEGLAERLCARLGKR